MLMLDRNTTMLLEDTQDPVRRDEERFVRALEKG